MSSSLRRGTLAATALGIAVATLSACGAGSDAQTLQIEPNSAATSLGHIKIQDVNIVTVPGRSGTAAVTARIFNNGSTPEKLKSISVQGAGTRVQLSPGEGKSKSETAGGSGGGKALTVPAGGSLALGGKGDASAQLTGASPKSVRNGNAQPVTFDLSRTGEVRLRAAVLPATGELKGAGPSVQPSPSGSSSESPSESPSGKATSSASSASASPGKSSGSASASSESSQ